MTKAYTSSTTRADAPPPPLQTPPTPYFPFFCLSTYNTIMINQENTKRSIVSNTKINRSVPPNQEAREIEKNNQHMDRKSGYLGGKVQSKKAIQHIYIYIYPQQCDQDTCSTTAQRMSQGYTSTMHINFLLQIKQ